MAYSGRKRLDNPIRIIHYSRGASLALRYHSAFVSLANIGSIRSVAESTVITVITNSCAIQSLCGELSLLRDMEARAAIHL